MGVLKIDIYVMMLQYHKAFCDSCKYLLLNPEIMTLREQVCQYQALKVIFAIIDSFDGIKEMNRIIDTAHVLEAVLSVVPLFQLFASRSANGSVIIEGSASVVSTGINISIYDWKGFADAFKSVGIIRRRRLQDHADMTALNATGKDYEFWRCVSNAL